MNPELIINSQQIDLDICKLLGDKPGDFLVLCLNDVQLDGFGTPYDTPRNRSDRQGLVERLNDRSNKSLWPEMWRNWKLNICTQFKLPETTTEKVFRPVFSYKISRVCAGYSLYLHAAIGLFETLDDKIDNWFVSKNGKCLVEIKGKNGFQCLKSGDHMSLTIAESVREFLQSPTFDLTKK
jgi:hypothetical protein